MGCRILVGHEAGDRYGQDKAVFFCSTTDVAFGPVMNSEEEADKFCEWIPGDPRSYSAKELAEKYTEFVMLYVCECGTIRCDHCDYCDLSDYSDAVEGMHRDLTKPANDGMSSIACELEPEPAAGERYECSKCQERRQEKEQERRRAMEQDEMDRANHRGKYARK